MKKRIRRWNVLLGGVGFVAVVLFPKTALAWGPVTHIDLSIEVLSCLAALAPALYRRLKHHFYDFIYGSLAPDIIVGKNLASESTHSHSWIVAQKLYTEAKSQGEARQVFMMGYLAHLAADIIAHNHFVPAQILRWHRAKGVGHLYWEARYDQKILKDNPALKEVWGELSRRQFVEHNRFLTDRLLPTVFSNGLSAHIYRQVLAMQRRRPWEQAFRRIDARSRLGFTQTDAQIWRKIAMTLVCHILIHPEGDNLKHLDPTGRSNLARALADRQRLRRIRRYR